jgi:hypothetical protein
MFVVLRVGLKDTSPVQPIKEVICRTFVGIPSRGKIVLCIDGGILTFLQPLDDQGQKVRE